MTNKETFGPKFMTNIIMLVIALLCLFLMTKPKIKKIAFSSFPIHHLLRSTLFQTLFLLRSAKISLAKPYFISLNIKIVLLLIFERKNNYGPSSSSSSNPQFSWKRPSNQTTLLPSENTERVQHQFNYSLIVHQNQLLPLVASESCRKQGKINNS